MPHVVSGIGAVWLLTLGVVAWMLGDPNSMDTDTVPRAFWVASVFLGVATLSFGAVLVHSKMGRWGFGAVPLGAAVGTALTSANAMRGAPDTWYPQFIFLIYIGLLGIGVAAGAVLGGLWRLGESRYERRAAQR